jgi:hypothetical protein
MCGVAETSDFRTMVRGRFTNGCAVAAQSMTAHSHYLGRTGINFKQGLERFEAYANNINQFDALKAKKGVFYFEDFVNNEEGTLAFLRFFDIDPGARPYNFREMIEASRGWYRGHHGLFAERERPRLKPKERTAILRMLKQELGENFERYLSRYSLDD